MISKAKAWLFTQILCSCLSASALAEPATPMPPSEADFQKLDALLGFLRSRNARDYSITSANGIDEARYIELGGIEQWVTIRGENRDNPVVLFLHGGPGDATNPWGYAGFRLWLKSFTVVQWDQRGAGKTLGRNGPGQATTISLDRMTRDGVELTERLLADLHKDKLILVGHSFGSILGIGMAKSRPELYYAFVGTGQVADPARSYTVAYSELMKKAEALGEQRAIDELREI